MISDYVTDLRRAVQGPDAMDLKFLPAFIAISFPFSIIVESATISNFRQLLDWMLVKFLGLFVLGSFYYFLRERFKRRTDKTVNVPALILLSGIGGIIQGAVIAFAMRKIGLVDVSDYWVRPLTGFFLGLSWLPINAVCMNAFYSYARQRQELQSKVQSLQQLRFNQSGLAGVIRENIEIDISRQLNLGRAQAKSKFDNSLRMGSSTDISSSLLRDFASTNLRDLSQQLWHQSTYPEIRESKPTNQFFELYHLGLHLPPIDSFFFSFTSATLLMPLALRNCSFGIGFILGMSFFLASFITMAALSPIAKKLSPKYKFAYPMRVVIATAVSMAVINVTRQRFAPAADQRHIFIGVTAFIFMCGVGLLISLAKSGLVDQDKVVEALNATARNEKLAIGLAEVEIASISKQWAQHIHGSLQSQLTSIAALLEFSSAKGDTKTRELAIESAYALLNSDFSIKPELNTRDLMDEAIHRISQWADLIEFEVDCTLERDLPGIPVARFGDAIEEAITNAVRHGHASHMKISMALVADSALECIFTDDGTGIPANSVNGIGSAVFTTLAGANWSRTNREDGPGVRVKLVIPALELPPVGGGSSVG